MFPEGHKLSKTDFALIINHHELVHVRDQSFTLRTGAASPALGLDYRAIMTDFIKTNLLREAEANREARARDY